MRLIDADALIGELHNYRFYDGDDRTIVYAVIENQHTIEPQKWIPCSERLPSEQDYKACYEAPNGTVWYCTSEGLIGLGWYYESTLEWANLNNEAIVGDVIGWMPLPEPYEENKE